MEKWLTATGEGVTKGTATLDGREWIRVDYGDGGTVDYVLSDGANVRSSRRRTRPSRRRLPQPSRRRCVR